MKAHETSTQFPPSPPELLTVEQFAIKLQVSRTTVFHLLKTGDLLEGVHYIRLGRILRFRWQEELLFRKKAASSTRKAPKKRPTSPGSRALPSQPAVNLDYGAAVG